MLTIHKGDTIRILPDWQDPGDDKFTWVAISDEDRGRIAVSPIDTGLSIPPIYVVHTYMLESL